jgi:ribonuclease HI
MEPTRLNGNVPAGKKAVAEEPQPSPAVQSVAAPEPTATPDPPRRERVPRRVTAYATHDVAASGTAAWAVALLMHDDGGRTERREIGGTLPDPNGRAASMRAIRECVLAACEGSSRAFVTVETPSEQCVRAATDGGHPGARLPGEEHVWEAVDAAAAIHVVEFKVARTSIDRDLSERCDRLVRSLLEN